MLVYRTGRLVSQSAEAGKCDLLEQFAALFAVVAMSRISYQAILALQVSGSGRDAFGVMRTQFAGGKHSTLRLRREHMARRFCFFEPYFPNQWNWISNAEAFPDEPRRALTRLSVWLRRQAIRMDSE